jgi:two-component system sensor histidine kinase SenX3
MNMVAQDVVARYADKARERGVTLRFTPVPDLPPVSGDAKSLDRALMALVDNAIKFSPKGGNVDIHLIVEPDTLLVDVHDNGIGIPKENLRKIFDRFYHLERHEDDLFGGIGLGLAITRQVIEQHHGKLEVISDAEHGTTFTIILERSK